MLVLLEGEESCGVGRASERCVCVYVCVCKWGGREERRKMDSWQPQPHAHKLDNVGHHRHNSLSILSNQGSHSTQAEDQQRPASALHYARHTTTCLALDSCSSNSPGHHKRSTTNLASDARCPAVFFLQENQCWDTAGSTYKAHIRSGYAGIGILRRTEGRVFRLS